jgi:hypothetical protein
MIERIHFRNSSFPSATLEGPGGMFTLRLGELAREEMHEKKSKITCTVFTSAEFFPEFNGKDLL